MKLILFLAICLSACSGGDALDSDTSFEETDAVAQAQAKTPSAGQSCVARCPQGDTECPPGKTVVTGTMDPNGMCCGPGPTPGTSRCSNCSYYDCSSKIFEPGGGTLPPPKEYAR